MLHNELAVTLIMMIGILMMIMMIMIVLMMMLCLEDLFAGRMVRASKSSSCLASL